MRARILAPLMAAVALSACGDGKDAGDALTAEQVAAEAAKAIKPLPGQYSTKVELLEFEVPGMTDAMKVQMKAMAESGLAQGNSFCLTEQDADPRKMLENIAESDCTFNQFDVSGGTVKADMACKGQGNVDARVQMDGTMTPESSTMTMSLHQPMANMGDVQMKMRVTSTRTGECS